jgi:hypothetical protein
MGKDSDLDKVYAKNMQHHPYGYALYKPMSSTILKPGSCGYFDSLGAWNPIANLDDVQSLQKYGLQPPKERLEKAPPEENITWGPKVSQNVTEQRMDLSGGARYANLYLEYTDIFKHRGS